MAQPVYNEHHPLQDYLERSGETELMPGGSHHMFQDDIQEEDEEEETNDENPEAGGRQHDRPARRRRHRRRQRSEYRAEGTLAGVGVVAGICGYHSMALVVFAGATYPHLRARIGQHAHDLLHPLLPSSRNRAEAPSGPPPPMNRLHSMHLQAAPSDTVNVDEDTWTSAAAAFDRVQAQDWAEVCLLAASLSFLFRQHTIAGLFLLTSLYPYLDAIIPRFHSVIDATLVLLHNTLPAVPMNKDGGSSLMAHAASIRVEKCSFWAEVWVVAATVPLLFGMYPLSFAFLAASLYPYLDAILPRVYTLMDMLVAKIIHQLPEIPEQQIYAAASLALEIWQSFLASISPRRVDRARRKELAERFKYDVISSSLLSTSLSGPPSSHGRDWHSRTRATGKGVPGRYNHSVGSSRDFASVSASEAPSDMEPTEKPATAPTTSTSATILPTSPSPPHIIQICIGLCLSAVLALSYSQHLLASILVAAAAYTYLDQDPPAVPQDGLALALEDLEELLGASNYWDSTVQEALAHLESQERGTGLPYQSSSQSQLPHQSPIAGTGSYSPGHRGLSSTSPLASLRVALNTALHTTRTQCEKVRPLLAALAGGSDLSPLTEMYAPPSPGGMGSGWGGFGSGSGSGSRYGSGLGSGFGSGFGSGSGLRSAFAATTLFADMQDAGAGSGFGNARVRTTSLPSAANKRATWNGSYAALALAGSPTRHALGRTNSAKRRSEVLGTSATPWTALSVVSAPVSPNKHALAGVLEEDHDQDQTLGQAQVRDQDQDDDHAARYSTPRKQQGRDHSLSPSPPRSPDYFGAQAMELRKRRRRAGLSTLGLEDVAIPSSSSGPALSGVSAFSGITTPKRHSHRQSMQYTTGHGGLGMSASPGFASASRLTALPTSRHPLALSALRHGLTAALGARRYACAHLLALRFPGIASNWDGDNQGDADMDVDSDAGEGRYAHGHHHHAGQRDSDLNSDPNPDSATVSDDSEYWADVRSVVALLTTTFADASSHLAAALDDVESRRAADEIPSRRASRGSASEALAGQQSQYQGQSHSRSHSELLAAAGLESKPRLRTSTAGLGLALGADAGFAPMPSRVAKFAAHVDAIMDALDDAKTHLQATVVALREDQSLEDLDATVLLPQDTPALKAYEGLRRELGYALRECERGRERLLDVIAARAPQPAQDSDGDVDHEQEEHDVPHLAHDVGSDRSSGEIAGLRTPGEVAMLETTSGPRGHDEGEDDAHAALLRATSALGLPPPGIEQVFEADPTGTAVGSFERERSKLSREERIERAKAAREARMGGEGPGRLGSFSGSLPGSPSGPGPWGPGGDVVQELKDVIWKVGERRRQIGDAHVQAEQLATVPQSVEISSPL